MRKPWWNRSLVRGLLFAALGFLLVVLLRILIVTVFVAPGARYAPSDPPPAAPEFHDFPRFDPPKPP